MIAPILASLALLLVKLTLLPNLSWMIVASPIWVVIGCAVAAFCAGAFFHLLFGEDNGWGGKEEVR